MVLLQLAQGGRAHWITIQQLYTCSCSSVIILDCSFPASTFSIFIWIATHHPQKESYGPTLDYNVFFIILLISSLTFGFSFYGFFNATLLEVIAAFVVTQCILGTIQSTPQEINIVARYPKWKYFSYPSITSMDIGVIFNIVNGGNFYFYNYMNLRAMKKLSNLYRGYWNSKLYWSHSNSCLFFFIA